MGLKFRRQVPINRFVADFVCEANKIVIELDDAGHDQKVEKDAERTKTLETYGYHVIRFANEEIYEDLDAVLDTLSFEIGKSA